MITQLFIVCFCCHTHAPSPPWVTALFCVSLASLLTRASIGWVIQSQYSQATFEQKKNCSLSNLAHLCSINIVIKILLVFSTSKCTLFWKCANYVRNLILMLGMNFALELVFTIHPLYLHLTINDTSHWPGQADVRVKLQCSLSKL